MQVHPRSRPGPAFVAFAAILLLAACDEEAPVAEDTELTDPDADATVTDDTSTTGDTTTAPSDTLPEVADDVPMARIRLVPFELLSEDNVVGAEVCTTADPPECATTTIEGATVEVPERVNIYMTVTAPGYVDTLYPVPGTRGDAAWVFPVVLEGVADAVAELAGVDREPGGATLIAAASAGGSVGDPGSAGATFAIDVAGDGPFYVTDDNALSRDDNVTGARGAAVFLNLFEDTVVVRVDAPDRDCVVHGPGWPLSADEPDAARVALEPDTITHVQYSCTARN